MEHTDKYIVAMAFSDEYVETKLHHKTSDHDILRRYVAWNSSKGACPICGSIHATHRVEVVKGKWIPAAPDQRSHDGKNAVLWHSKR